MTMNDLTIKSEDSDLVVSYDEEANTLVFALGHEEFILPEQDAESLERMAHHVANEWAARGHNGEAERALEAIPEFFPDAYAVEPEVSYDPETGDANYRIEIFVSDPIPSKSTDEDWEDDHLWEALWALEAHLWPEREKKWEIAPRLHITWLYKDLHPDFCRRED